MMISRRAFIQKGAALITAGIGAGTMIPVSSELLADDGVPLAVQTYLAAADVESITRTMREIDDFGDPGPGAAVSDDIFTPGIALSRYVERYAAAVRARYPLRAAGSGAFDGITYARSCDAYLMLLETLIELLTDRIMSAYVRQARIALYPEQRERLDRDLIQVFDALCFVAKEWKIDGRACIDDEGKSPYRIMISARDRYVKRGPVPRITLKSVIEGGSDYISLWGANRYLRASDAVMHEISTWRYWCKALHSRYALLSLFEEQYRRVAAGHEKIGSERVISAGAEQFVGKSLCALLFMELALMRIRLLAFQGRSGMFTRYDRQHFQMECSTLVDTLGEMGQRPVFAGRAIFDGGFSANPVRIKTGGKLRSLAIDRIDLAALGLRNDHGNNSLHLSTPEGVDHAVRRVDRALEKLRRQRERLLGGIPG